MGIVSLGHKQKRTRLLSAESKLPREWPNELRIRIFRKFQDPVMNFKISAELDAPE